VAGLVPATHVLNHEDTKSTKDEAHDLRTLRVFVVNSVADEHLSMGIFSARSSLIRR
jgi:hypothetical protein